MFLLFFFDQAKFSLQYLHHVDSNLRLSVLVFFFIHNSCVPFLRVGCKINLQTTGRDDSHITLATQYTAAPNCVAPALRKQMLVHIASPTTEWQCSFRSSGIFFLLLYQHTLSCSFKPPVYTTIFYYKINSEWY